MARKQPVFITGAQIEVNDPEKGGIKPSAQPAVEEKPKPARKSRASAAKAADKTEDE